MNLLSFYLKKQERLRMKDNNKTNKYFTVKFELVLRIIIIMIGVFGLFYL